MLQFSCWMYSSRVVWGVSANVKTTYPLILFFRALRLKTGRVVFLMFLSNFFTTWLELIDVSGITPNSGSQLWVHRGISWGTLKNMEASVPEPVILNWLVWGVVWAMKFKKLPKSLRITELRENDLEPLASAGKRLWRWSISHLPGTQKCRGLPLSEGWGLCVSALSSGSSTVSVF